MRIIFKLYICVKKIWLLNIFERWNGWSFKIGYASVHNDIFYFDLSRYCEWIFAIVVLFSTCDKIFRKTNTSTDCYHWSGTYVTCFVTNLSHSWIKYMEICNIYVYSNILSYLNACAHRLAGYFKIGACVADFNNSAFIENISKIYRNPFDINEWTSELKSY